MSNQYKTAKTEFTHILQNKRKKLLRSWFQLIADSYPEETSRFLCNQKDPFSNPVGASIHQGIENIFDELLLEHSTENIIQDIDGIVRVRAVQDFTPSHALAIFWGFKKVVREHVQDDIETLGLQAELKELEDKIDQLGLAAFDVYMKCREKIWELKAKEAQNRTKNLLRKRANVEWKKSEEPSE